MPRPVAIEARHHLAQRLLVEDQQAAPPTGQVVEATAQRRLDAALRAVAQALALAQLAAPDGPRARMRQGHRDAVFEHPDLDAAVLVAADQEPSTQRASAAAGAFHHKGPCLPPRTRGGAEDRAAFEQAHPSLAAVVGDIDGTLCVQLDLAAIHQPQDAYLALLLLLLSWLPLALGAHSLAALILGVLLLDLAGQAIHVLNQSLVFAIDPRAHSRLVGCYMLFYAAGSGLGASAGTAMYAWAGWDAVSLLGAAISLAALAFWWFTRGVGGEARTACANGA